MDPNGLEFGYPIRSIVIPELKAAGSHLEALDDHHHGHVPYILLLLHYLGNGKRNTRGITPIREFHLMGTQVKAGH